MENYVLVVYTGKNYDRDCYIMWNGTGGESQVIFHILQILTFSPLSSPLSLSFSSVNGKSLILKTFL